MNLKNHLRRGVSGKAADFPVLACGLILDFGRRDFKQVAIKSRPRVYGQALIAPTASAHLRAAASQRDGIVCSHARSNLASRFSISGLNRYPCCPPTVFANSRCQESSRWLLWPDQLPEQITCPNGVVCDGDAGALPNQQISSVGQGHRLPGNRRRQAGRAL